MTKKTITISNIHFENNQMMIQVPTELLSDKLATETYIRTWLFDNVALRYICKVSEQSVILEKFEQQPFDIDLVDFAYDDYQFVDIAIDQQRDYRSVVTDELVDMFDGVSMTAFFKLQKELPIEINVL